MKLARLWRVGESLSSHPQASVCIGFILFYFILRLGLSLLENSRESCFCLPRTEITNTNLPGLQFTCEFCGSNSGLYAYQASPLLRGLAPSFPGLRNVFRLGSPPVSQVSYQASLQLPAAVASRAGCCFSLGSRLCIVLLPQGHVS